MNETELLETLINKREEGKLMNKDRGKGQLDSAGHRAHNPIEANRDLS